jgi:tRNA-uridine 2-sulfurtransferase
MYSPSKPNFENKEQQLYFDSKPIQYNPEMGKVLGKHQGAHYFTNGQRKGLNIGGTKEGLFVLATNVTTNEIYTGQTPNHPGLFRKVLFIDQSEVHWIREDLRLQNGQSMQVMARIRYRQTLQKAMLYQFETGMYIEFEESQSAITSGQFVTWNMEDELVGSGVIA